MNFISRVDDLQQLLDALSTRAGRLSETEWTLVAYFEKELVKAREEEAEDNGQFGVGA